MKNLTAILITAAILCAGLTGITLSLPLHSPALILLGIAGLCSIWLLFKRPIQFSNTSLLLFVIFSITYFFIRSLISPVADLAREDLFLIISAGLLYCIAGYVTAFPNARTWIAYAVLFLLVLNIGSAIMQAFGGTGYSPLNLFISDLEVGPGTIVGMFGYRGTYGNFISIAGIMALSLAIWGRYKFSIRILLGVIGSIALVTVLISHSRSAALSLVAGFSIMCLLLWISSEGQTEKTRKRIKYGVTLFGGLAVILVVIGAALVLKSRSSGTIGLEAAFDSSVRLFYWAMAFEQFLDYPIFGAGSRSFSYECYNYWSPSFEKEAAEPWFVHNEYLQLLTDYGIAGLLIVLTLIFLHVKIGIKNIRKFSEKVTLSQGSNAVALGIAGVAGMLTMAAYIILDFRTHVMSNLLLFVCCAAWVLPVASSTSANKKHQFISRILMMMMLVGLSLSAIALGFVELRGGLPLLKHKMALEVSTQFTPSPKSKRKSSTALEESLEIAPSFRRHNLLGRMYLRRTNKYFTNAKENMEKAILHLEKAHQRHPYDPIYIIHLARAHTENQDYKKAEYFFKKVQLIAKRREPFYKTNLHWADMERQRGDSLLRKGNNREAEIRYTRAVELLKEKGYLDKDKGQMKRKAHDAYMKTIISHAQLLDNEKKFESSEALYKEAENNLGSLMHGARNNILLEKAEHYRKKGLDVWLQRKPDIALPIFLKAKTTYEKHKRLSKVKKNKRLDSGYKQVMKILEILDTGGIDAGKR